MNLKSRTQRDIGRRGFSNTFLWAIGFVVIVVIVAIAWFSFMVRATDSVLINQEFSARNLVYLSTIVLAAPGLLNYAYAVEEDISAKIEYHKSFLSLASYAPEVGTATGVASNYPAPSRYLHPFPKDYTLHTKDAFFDTLYFAMIGKTLMATTAPVADLECLHYATFKMRDAFNTPQKNMQQNSRILLLASGPAANTTREKLKMVQQRLGSTVVLDLSDLPVADRTNSYRLILTVSESSSLSQNLIRSATPSFSAKNIQCQLSAAFSADRVQEELEATNSSDAAGSSDAPSNDASIRMELVVADLNPLVLSDVLDTVLEEN